MSLHCSKIGCCMQCRHSKSEEIEDQDDDDATYNFLTACKKGCYGYLEDTFIPHVRRNKIDVCKLTNDRHHSATGLHHALLGRHGEVANLIMDEFGHKLILQPYTFDVDRGINALHIAITNNMPDQVKVMMKHLSEKGLETQKSEFLHAEYYGTLFKKEWIVSHVPLTLALLCENLEIAEILLDAGADYWYKAEQSNGDIIMHSLARHSLNSPEDTKTLLNTWLDLILKRHDNKKKAYEQIKNFMSATNYEGLTPLFLSLKIGASDMVQALLETKWVYKMPQQNYKPFHHLIFDVTHLTRKQTHWKISGLEMLAFNTDPKLLSQYKQEPIQTMVQEMWKEYWVLHVFGGIFHLAYIILFSLATMSPHILGRPALSVSGEEFWVIVICSLLVGMSFIWMILAIVDVAVFLSPLCARQKQSATESTQSVSKDAEQGQTTELKPLNQSTATDYLTVKHRRIFNIPLKLFLRMSSFKAVHFLQDSFIFIWCILRLVGSEYETTVASVPLILGWYYCICYTVFFERIFIFMLMMNKMLLSNIVYFLVALLFILIGFGSAFLVLHDPTSTENGDLFPFGSLMNTLFRQMLALTDINELMDQMKYPTHARLVMLSFLVVATVLLLNTLLASMNETFCEVKDNKVALWYRFKLQMALQAERPTYKWLKYLRWKPKQLRRQSESQKEGRDLLDVYVVDYKRKKP